MRRATSDIRQEMDSTSTFQSTLSMRRATLALFQFPPFVDISIHALHEESDLHIGSDTLNPNLFQSTLSMRRATVQLDIFVRFLRRKPAA